MPYDPDIHHRRSIRLPEYDYSCEGFYFVTICVHERRPLFGHIDDGVMHLNDAGRMVEKWYYQCAEHFPDIECMDMVIMPNHFHCIWRNMGDDIDNPVGADRCVRPGNEIQKGEHTGSPLHRVVQWFKTMTTNEYIRGVKQSGWSPFSSRLWQRNYYEHIIRNQRSFDEIVMYIHDNPIHWADDTLYVP